MHASFPALISPRSRSSTRRYASESTQDYVDRHIEPPLPPAITSFSSSETALSLAQCALSRSRRLLTAQSTETAELVRLKGACGVGAAACIASKEWKRGDHRLFVALCDYDRDVSFSVILHKVLPAPHHHSSTPIAHATPGNTGRSFSLKAGRG